MRVETTYSLGIHDIHISEINLRDDWALRLSPTPSDDTLLYKFNLSDETHEGHDYNTTDYQELAPALVVAIDIQPIISDQTSQHSREIWHSVQPTLFSMGKCIQQQEILQ